MMCLPLYKDSMSTTLTLLGTALHLLEFCIKYGDTSSLLRCQILQKKELAESDASRPDHPQVLVVFFMSVS